MAKLTRFVQKLFGSAAPIDTMSQFGGFAANQTTTYSGTTISPDLVQALSNYLSGWTGAVVGNDSSFIEDLNSLSYLYAYQLCYMFQSGIPEWNTATTYYIGSLVNSAGTIYQSLTDSNVGNALSDATNWVIQNQTGAGLFSLNNSPYSVTVPTGESLFVPFLNIQTGHNYIVSTGAEIVSVTSITVSGTGTLTLQGTAVGRVL